MNPEQRNTEGYPCFDGPRTRPRSNVYCEPGSAIGGNVQVDQRTDNSVNPGLHWAAAFCGGGALFAVLVLAILKPWETADRAARAELEAAFAQRLASVEIEAHNAASISEVWRNRVNKLEAEANAQRTTRR